MSDEPQKAEPSARHHVWLGDEDLGVLDEEKFTNSDGFLILNATGGRGQGLTPRQFFAGITEMDPLAMQALIWFLRFKKDPATAGHISQVDFAYGDLRTEDEPDPTEAISGTDETPISELSPTTAI